MRPETELEGRLEDRNDNGGAMSRYKRPVITMENGDGRQHMLKIREASELLRIHPNTLRRWGDQGLVKVYRIGPRGDRRFKLEDIAVVLTERTEESQAKARKHSLKKRPG